MRTGVGAGYEVQEGYPNATNQNSFLLGNLDVYPHGEGSKTKELHTTMALINGQAPLPQHPICPVAIPLLLPTARSSPGSFKTGP